MHRFREPVNGFTHLAGAIFAAFGLVWLLAVAADNSAKMITVLIYGITMIMLYSASAAYHLSYGSPRKILWLRRCDHAAIYLLIAGTYTPVFYNLLDGAWRWGMLALIWSLALTGAIYKLFFMHHAGYLSLLCYIVLGSAGVVVFPRVVSLLPSGAAAYMVVGCLLYLIGAIIFGLQRPNFNRHFGHHEIWHLFVMGGNAFTFVAMVHFLSG